MIYRRIVACFNEIIIHCGQPNWYMMLLKEKTSFISLKSNTEQCFDSTLYQTIYRCIVIHQRQYIDTSTHCIVATLDEHDTEGAAVCDDIQGIDNYLVTMVIKFLLRVVILRNYRIINKPRQSQVGKCHDKGSLHANDILWELHKAVRFSN